MSGEKLEVLVDFMLRMAVSLALPVWGAVMIGLGASWRSPWWAGCGAVVLAIGLLLAVGNPLADRSLREL
jgi:hypothetical protein